MKRKRVGLAIVGFLATLLVVLPALVGCAGEERDERVITIGILADFTGVAAHAMQPTIEAAETYLTKVVPETNPLPGVRVRFTHFDTRLDYSRTVPGYLTLRGRGVDMMLINNAQDVEILGDRPAQDSMPILMTMGLEAKLDYEWIVSTVSTVQSQGEAVMRFIMDQWEEEGKSGTPKVGHLGYDLAISAHYQQGIDRVLDEDPDKFTWSRFERGRLGETAWGPEVGRLKDCDYIIVSVSGPMLSSFVSQARAAGYTGAFVTGMEGFAGFWGLVQGATSAAQLYDCYFVAWWPWWNEDVPFIQECKDYIATYQPGKAEELMDSSAVISGWGMGMVLEAAIRNAIDAVGVENIDGVALKDGLRAVEIEVQGFGDVWKVTENNNCHQWQQRAFEWNMDLGDWVPLPTYYDPTLSRPAD